jgi:hypothetical protein
MDKDYLCEKLKEYKIGSQFKLIWDRGNGPLEQIVLFQGFDRNNDPLLKAGNYGLLSIEKIGGYKSIISFEKNHIPTNLKTN